MTLEEFEYKSWFLSKLAYQHKPFSIRIVRMAKLLRGKHITADNVPEQDIEAVQDCLMALWLFSRFNLSS